MDDYEFVVDVRVRLRDVDEMGHVNNAVYLTYLEIARDRYVADVVGETLIELGAALAHVEVDYLAPIAQGDDVAVGVRVRDVGTTSITMDYEIRADGEPAASAETTLVPYDGDAGETKLLPDHWREAITAFEGL